MKKIKKKIDFSDTLNYPKTKEGILKEMIARNFLYEKNGKFFANPDLESQYKEFLKEVKQ